MIHADRIAIEIGGTKLQAATGNVCGAIDATVSEQADAAGGAPAILRQLEAMVGRLVAASRIPFRAIGIGFGGPVDETTGVVAKSNQVAGWENASLIDWAREKFGLPCAVRNDTDAAALAEARVGGGTRYRCVFYTNIGSGIGGGLVVNGALYSRPRGAMEVGHCRVYSRLAGRLGILEEFCSGWALDRRARDAAAANPASLMHAVANQNGTAIDASTLFAAWQQGDAAARDVVDDFLDCYAATMANVVALLNPDVVLVGGGVAQVGAPLLSAIRQRMTPLIYAPFATGWRIELASLGARAVPTGALLITDSVVP